jgi:hypothetical protein
MEGKTLQKVAIVFCITLGIFGKVQANSTITRQLDFNCRQNETISMMICEITTEELTSDEIDIIPANISDNVGKLFFTKHKKVNHLPSSIFKQCQKLKIIEAHDVFLIELKEETLENATSLEQFLCNGNKIEELIQYTFLGAPNLEVIELYGNRISVIHNKAFYGLTKLKMLQLGSNIIQRLGKNSFESLINLKRLFMHHGKMKFISNELFKNTVELEEIYIDYQMINFIQPNFTDSMKKLKILKLRGNPCVTMTSPWLARQIEEMDIKAEAALKKLDQCYNNYNQIRDDLSICDGSTAVRLNKITEEKEAADRQIKSLQKSLNSTIDQAKVREKSDKEAMEVRVRNLHIVIVLLSLLLTAILVIAGVVAWKKFGITIGGNRFTQFSNSLVT